MKESTQQVLNAFLICQYFIQLDSENTICTKYELFIFNFLYYIIILIKNFEALLLYLFQFSQHFCRKQQIDQ